MAYSTNIKQLLDCEAEAQAIINEAKAYRVNRKLKQVKKDAASEVEEYKNLWKKRLSFLAKSSDEKETLNKESKQVQVY